MARYDSINGFYDRYHKLKVRMDLAKEDLLGDKDGVVNLKNFESINSTESTMLISIPRFYKKCMECGDSLIAFLQNFNLGSNSVNDFVNNVLSKRLELYIHVASFLFSYNNPHAISFIYGLKDLYEWCFSIYGEDIEQCKDS